MPRLAALVIAASLAAGQSALAQDADSAYVERGPRFLLASAAVTGKPVRVDVAMTPTLRRRISLDLHGVALPEALREVSHQAGVQLAFSNAVLPADRRVEFRADNITVAAALTELLLDAQVDILFSRDGRGVLVRRQEGVLQVGTIVGRVTDKKTGAAVSGATVVVEGTPRGATTGNDGRYRISDVAPGTYTLRARYIGFAPGAASVTVTTDQEATADLALEKSAQKLDQVVVTGTVVATAERGLANPISVITADDIAKLGITRVDQLFRGTIPGAVSPDLGILDPLPKVFTRGAQSTSPRRYGNSMPKTYIDGVETTDPNTLAQLDPNRIERVEIVRGPQASAVYGSGAIEGVMQIFTKTGSLGLTKPHLDVTSSVGSLESQWSDRKTRQDHSLTLTGGLPQLAYSLGGGYQSTGEWVPGYHSNNKSFFGSVQTQQGPVRVQFSGAYSDNPYSYPYTDPYTVEQVRLGRWHTPDDADVLTPNFIDFRTLEQTYGLNVDAQATHWWQHHLLVGYDGTHETNTQTQPRLLAPDDTLEPFIDARLGKISLGYNTTLASQLASGVSSNLTLGLDYWEYRQNIESGNRQQGVIVGPATVQEAEYDNTGYFGQAQVGIRDALFLSGGVRVDRNDNFGSAFGNAVAPKAGVAFVQQVGPVTAKVRGSFGRAIRAPSPTQRLADDRFFTQLANPDLGPETQQGWDAGVDLYVGTRASLQVTYYDQRVENLITFLILSLPSAPRLIGQYQNLGQVKNTGWETQGSVEITRWLSATASYSRARSIVRQLGPGLIGDGSGQFHLGDQIPGVPVASGGLTLSYSGARTRATVGMTYIGSFRGYDNQAQSSDLYGGGTYRGTRRAYLIDYPGFAKFNINLAQDLTRNVGAFVRVENVANSQAVETDNLSPVYGRLSVVGLKLKL